MEHMEKKEEKKTEPFEQFKKIFKEKHEELESNPEFDSKGRMIDAYENSLSIMRETAAKLAKLEVELKLDYDSLSDMDKAKIKRLKEIFKPIILSRESGLYGGLDSINKEFERILEDFEKRKGNTQLIH